MWWYVAASYEDAAPDAMKSGGFLPEVTRAVGGSGRPPSARPKAGRRGSNARRFAAVWS